MKKLTFIVLCVISVSSFGQTQKRPPGWATATVDAGGALAGGLGVLQVTGGVAATNPWGWAATGIGAVIGGAAASVGFAYNKTTNDATSSNPGNDLNVVGVKHNEIVRDYFNFIKDQNVSVENYLQYFETQQPTVYADVKKIINSDYLNQQKKEIDNLIEDEDFINWNINKLPSDVNKADFKDFLTKYKQITSKDEALKHITDYENRLLVSNLSKESVELLKYYFATLRNSTVLW